MLVVASCTLAPVERWLALRHGSVPVHDVRVFAGLSEIHAADIWAAATTLQRTSAFERRRGALERPPWAHCRL